LFCSREKSAAESVKRVIKSKSNSWAGWIGRLGRDQWEKFELGANQVGVALVTVLIPPTCIATENLFLLKEVLSRNATKELNAKKGKRGDVS
jgi:hypothetical protein